MSELNRSLSLFIFFQSACKSKPQHSGRWGLLLFHHLLGGGTGLFQKLISSIAVQLMQVIQMIHNSHIWNMPTVKNSPLFLTANRTQRCIFHCVWQIICLRYCVEGMWINNIKYISAKSSKKSQNNQDLNKMCSSYIHIELSAGVTAHHGYHRNRNKRLRYNKKFMVHLTDHISVFLCTI